MAYVPETQILDLKPEHLYPQGRDLRPEFFQHQRTPLMSRETPVASIGSCFAREIKDYLVEKGFNYLQTATGKNARHGSAAWDRVYNTFCLLQEFERAIEGFEPHERFWELDGKLLDPYRKKVEWRDRAHAEEELELHRVTAREAITRAEVMIITVGLTEIWYSKVDGSVFFQVPPAPIFDPELHAFRNSTVDENLGNLESIHRVFKKGNPEGKIIITVSPVPLRATFREQNVVVANTTSKATLVVATQQFVANHDDVYYFPSYELVTTVIPKAFERDNRHVKRRTVRKIMKAFEAMYVE